MLDWVALVLKLYVATAPEGIVPVIFLDMFKVHMMALIVNVIQVLGVQVEFWRLHQACSAGRRWVQ